jgi:hypothetical protein
MSNAEDDIASDIERSTAEWERDEVLKLAAIRTDALEEAAKECENGTDAGAYYAYQIRALKSRKP